jgi:hypothetical protein
LSQQGNSIRKLTRPSCIALYKNTPDGLFHFKFLIVSIGPVFCLGASQTR